MKKSLFIIIILSLYIQACGPISYEQDRTDQDGANDSTGIGETFSAESDDNFSEDEVMYIKEICEAMDTRVYQEDEDRVVDSELKYKYETTFRDCGVSLSKKDKDKVKNGKTRLKLKLIDEKIRFVFDSGENKEHFFDEYITSDDETFGDICEKANSEEGNAEISRYIVKGGGAYATKLVFSNCSNSSRRCLVKNTGKKNNAGEFEVYNVEQIFINVSNDLDERGIIEMHSRKSSKACSKKNETTFLKALFEKTHTGDN